jgi:hypothetical protein
VGSNIDSFIAQTNKEIKKLQEKQVSKAKQIALGAYNEIIERSPVSTGLFKHNNFLTVNGTTSKTTDEPHNEVLDGGKNNIQKAKFENNDTVVIQNHLTYADALEAGHSKQAPAGVYGVTEQKVKRELAKRTKI